MFAVGLGGAEWEEQAGLGCRVGGEETAGPHEGVLRCLGRGGRRSTRASKGTKLQGQWGLFVFVCECVCVCGWWLYTASHTVAPVNDDPANY
jgi:hypothetical protein